MNSQEVGGVIRAIVTAVVCYAAGKGIIPADTDTAAIVAAITTIGVAVWSVVSKKPKE